MYETVEGLDIPARLAGHPALEICNTRAGWGEQRPKEYLLSYDHLAVWARENGLVSVSACRLLRTQAVDDPRSAESALRRAIAFRSALYDVAGHPQASDRSWARVARAAERASALLRLHPGPARWELDEVRAGLDLPLLAAGRAAADWLTGGASYARACPGHGCGWVFVDVTGRRRWCSMARCGNRAKARRHAARTRGAHGRADRAG